MSKVRLFICDECRKLENPPALNSCAGCKKLKATAWYAANKEKYAKWRRKWRQENPEAWLKLRREHNAKYRKAHPDRRNEAKKRQRERHRDKYLEQHRVTNSRIKYGEFGSAHRALVQLTRELRKLQKETK